MEGILKDIDPLAGIFVETPIPENMQAWLDHLLSYIGNFIAFGNIFIGPIPSFTLKQHILGMNILH